MHRKIRIKRIILIAMSSMMTVVFVFGIYSFFNAPAKAKEAQEEVERVLREKQEKQNQMMKEKTEQNSENEQVKQAAALMQQLQEDKPINLHEQYTYASQLHITGIGDSVMLAATDALYQIFPYLIPDLAAVLMKENPFWNRRKQMVNLVTVSFCH